MDKPKRKILLIAGSIVFIAALCISVGFNIYFELAYTKQDSYLQSTEEIYILEAGILKNN